MRALRLLRVSRTVGDLLRATAFYQDALGFMAAPACDADPALAGLLGAGRLRTVQLRRGNQSLELAAFDPAGAAYPHDSRSNDLWFQHLALVVDDMDAAYAQLGRYPFTAISRGGPQILPGGIAAFKFRDADGHPLELIQFPTPNPITAGGIDHSAICVADTARSIAFYAGVLGLRVASQQVNAGPAQDALDGLAGTSVDVAALASDQAAPHVELLGYRTPPGRPAPPRQQADLAASRLVFLVDSLAGHPGAVRLADRGTAALMHDPRRARLAAAGWSAALMTERSGRS